MAYSALAVSKFIINSIHETEEFIFISNFKLQKILYFIQVYYICYFNKPCFKEKIYAWDFGPIVLEVYELFKMYGGNTIPPIVKDGYNDEHIPKESISDEDKEVILDIAKSTAKYNDDSLRRTIRKRECFKNALKGFKQIPLNVRQDLEYKYGKGWPNFIKITDYYATPENEITLESMKEYLDINYDYTECQNKLLYEQNFESELCK